MSVAPPVPASALSFCTLQALPRLLSAFGCDWTVVWLTEAGHVTGGRVFGYDNVCSACGRVIPAGTTRCCREGHTAKRINDAHAAIMHEVTAYASNGFDDDATLLVVAVV